MDRYRWRTLGIVIAFIVVQMMLRILAVGADSFAWVGWFTVFTLYEPETAVMVSHNDPQLTWSLFIDSRVKGTSQWGPMAASGWLFLLAATSYLIAFRKFLRRDLPAPL
jgi:hypothetical protein